jgi:Tfp pilus assembly protein PilF
MQTTLEILETHDSAGLRTQSAPKTNRFADLMLRPEVLLRFVLYLTLVANLPAVLFDYVYDDVALIQLSPWMVSWKGLVMAFTRPFWTFADYPRATDYYRPLTMSFLWVIRHTFGTAPGWFHLVAIGVHVLAVYLVYRLACELTKNSTLAAIAAAIFGLHPTKIESVAWISGVSDSLCLVFFLGSIILFLRWKCNGRSAYRWWSVVLAACAMLSKEMAVAIPLLIAVYEFLSAKSVLWRRTNSTVQAAAPHAAVVGAILMLRAIAMRSFATPVGYKPHFMFAIYTAPKELGWYFCKQFWPTPVSIQYPMLLIKQPSLTNFVLPAALLVIAAVTLAMCVRRSVVGWFLIAWFVVTLGPVLVYGHILQLHDRHMYAPSVATAIGLAYLIVRFVKATTRSGFPLRTALVATLCVICAAVTVVQARFWSDDVTLFTRAIEIASDHEDAYAALATAYIAKGDFPNAERVSTLWIRNTHESINGWCELAAIRAERQDLVGAQSAYEQALKHAHEPYKKVRPAVGLGWVAERRGHYPEAVSWYALAAAGEPTVSDLHEKYGQALLHIGKTTEGNRELQTARSLRQFKGITD